MRVSLPPLVAYYEDPLVEFRPRDLQGRPGELVLFRVVQVTRHLEARPGAYDRHVAVVVKRVEPLPSC